MARHRLILLALLAVACSPADGRERVFLITTTTVEGSGLLDTLVSAYHTAQGRYRLAPTAVGSGAALTLGRRGDADLLLTHDPVGESLFVADGHGRGQGPVMLGEFVVVGPSSDPAGVRGVSDLAQAMARIAAAGAPFVSRGDDSGTHRREEELWARSGGGTRTRAYVLSGSGMEETLRIADQRRAYALTDLGTFRYLAHGLTLEVLARGQPPEPNRYSFTVPIRQSHPEGARDFLDWLLGPGQAVIASWDTVRFGTPLFEPAGRR